MKIERMYRSVFWLPGTANMLALRAFKRQAWQEPDEEDRLRDTVVNRKHLEFIKKLVDEGKLSG